MTMHARRRPRAEAQEENREAFVNQAAAEETTQLHCMIPEGLHHRFRVMAAEERTTMTALVIEAMQNFVAARNRR